MGERRQCCRIEPLICGIWWHLQVDSVRIGLNHRTPSWCKKCLVMWKKPTHIVIDVNCSCQVSSGSDSVEVRFPYCWYCNGSILPGLVGNEGNRLVGWGPSCFCIFPPLHGRIGEQPVWNPSQPSEGCALVVSCSASKEDIGRRVGQECQGMFGGVRVRLIGEQFFQFLPISPFSSPSLMSQENWDGERLNHSFKVS